MSELDAFSTPDVPELDATRCQEDTDGWVAALVDTLVQCPPVVEDVIVRDPQTVDEGAGLLAFADTVGNRRRRLKVFHRKLKIPVSMIAVQAVPAFPSVLLKYLLTLTLRYTRR